MVPRSLLANFLSAVGLGIPSKSKWWNSYALHHNRSYQCRQYGVGDDSSDPEGCFSISPSVVLRQQLLALPSAQRKLLLQRDHHGLAGRGSVPWTRWFPHHRMWSWSYFYSALVARNNTALLETLWFGVTLFTANSRQIFTNVFPNIK